MKFLLPSLFAGLSFACSLSAQSIDPLSPRYHEGVPYNFVSTKPRADTFYYNDFNRYELSYTDELGSRVDIRYFGSNGGNGNDRDYNGAALIGNSRGTFSGALTSLSLRRLTSGTQPYLHTNNLFDLGYTEPVSGAGLPAGSGHVVTTEGRNNSIEFYIENPSVLSSYARFSISTAGYENLRLTFDITPGLASSANYRLMASADGGATWSLAQDFYGVTPANWSNLEIDLSAHPEFANNPGFAFQMISIPNAEGVWENVNGDTATGNGLGVGALHLLFDRVTLSGTAVPSLTPLEQWRQLHFDSPDATGPAANDADPDGDGLANLLEYALGGLPKSPDSDIAPTVSIIGDRLNLTFDRTSDPALLYEVEAISALDTTDWPAIWSSTGAQNTAETVTVPDTVDLDAQTRRFLRLRVSLAP